MRGFIFDLDGVINSTEDYNFLAWEYALKSIKVKFDRSVFNEIRDFTPDSALVKIFSISSFECDEKFFQKILTKRNKKFRTLLLSLATKDSTEENRFVLLSLKRRGFKLGAVSVNQNTKDILKAALMEWIFDYIKCDSSEDDRFLAAAAQMELNPEECYVFVNTEPIETIANLKDFKIISFNKGEENHLGINEFSDVLEISCRAI